MATTTYKIPSYLPNIKAAKISVPNNAYTNPQPIIDKSFEVFNKGIQKAIGTFATNARLEREYRRKEKEDQLKLIKTQSDYSEQQMNQIVGLKNTGSAQFDANKQNYFYQLKENYIKIKNMMDKNPDLHESGAKELAKINNEIFQYKEMAPKMLNQIVFLREALKIPPGQPGAISSETPGTIQRMLLAIVEGGPNVSLASKDGNLYLYMPPQTYEQDGETLETDGQQINISEFLNITEGGGEVIKTIPDYQKELKDAADAVIKMENGEDNPLYYKLNEVSVGDNNNAVVKEWNSQVIDPATNKQMIGSDTLDVLGFKIKNPFAGKKINGEMLAQMDLIRTGAFESLLKPDDPNDNDMAVIWADVIPDSITGDDAWNPANKDQLSKALGWLSQQAVAEYGLKEGVLTHQKKPKPETVDTKAIKNNKAANTIFTNLEKIRSGESDPTSFLRNKKINGKDIITEADGEKVTFLKDGVLTIGYDTGKGGEDVLVDKRIYNLNDPGEYKTFISDFVFSKYSGQRAEDIRDAITATIDQAIADSETNKEKWDKKKEKTSTSSRGM